MKLKFLGTRGEIDLRTSLHALHTSMQIAHQGRRVMIDCGLDWIDRIRRMRPHAIVLTHAHPDHAWGLQNGAPCRVLATEETWRLIEDYPLTDRETIKARSPVEVQGVTFEAFPVEHSTRCPAVGYRIKAGKTTIFYVPDLVFIREAHDALTGADLYIGDGASLRRPLVRKRGEALLGHAAVRTQLGWCQREGVPKAVITHCGSEIVGSAPGKAEEEVRRLGAERGLTAELAYDGLEIALP